MMFSSTSNVYVAIYRTDSGARIEAIAGTLSGTTFTWGTAVAVAASSDYCAGAWDAVNNKFVVVNVTTGGNMNAYVLTVSGTTISVGAVTNIETTGDVTGRAPSVAYEPTSGKIVLLYVLSSVPYARIGTVSGTTSSWTAIVFGESVFTGNNAKNLQVYCVNGLVVFNATRNTAPNYIYLQVGTISGTTLTLGTFTEYTATSVDFGTVVFSPDYNSYYWCGKDLNASAFLSILSFTITSALSITFNGTLTATTIPVRSESEFSSAYDPIAKRVVIGYSAVTTSYGTVVSMLNPNVLGSPVTVQSLVAAAASFTQGSLVYSSTAGKVVGATVGTSTRVYGAVITTEASSNVNTIGLSTAAVSDGASASCTIIGGVNTGVSGLTTGLTYYASPTGTITTSPVSNFKLGRALSATSLLVTNGTFP
jgi:hypothetical protein